MLLVRSILQQKSHWIQASNLSTKYLYSLGLVIFFMNAGLGDMAQRIYVVLSAEVQNPPSLRDNTIFS